MYCNKCGTSMPDDSMFCPKCGSVVEGRVRTVSRTCKSCGAPMTMNPNHTEYTCEYCGNREIIAEYNEMVLDSMRSKVQKETELHNSYAQARHEIELDRLRKESRQEMINRKIAAADKDRLEHDYIDGVFFWFAIAFLPFALLGLFIGFLTRNIMSSGIAVLQIGLFAASIYIGLRKNRERVYELHRYAVIVGMALGFFWWFFHAL